MKFDITRYKSIYKHILRKMDDLHSEEDVIIFEINADVFVKRFVDKYYSNPLGRQFFLNQDNDRWFEKQAPSHEVFKDVQIKCFEWTDEETREMFYFSVRLMLLECINGHKLYESIIGE